MPPSHSSNISLPLGHVKVAGPSSARISLLARRWDIDPFKRKVIDFSCFPSPGSVHVPLPSFNLEFGGDGNCLSSSSSVALGFIGYIRDAHRLVAWERKGKTRKQALNRRWRDGDGCPAMMRR